MLSWNVKLLDKSYGDWANGKEPKIIPAESEIDDDEYDDDAYHIPAMIPHDYESEVGSDLDINEDHYDPHLSGLTCNNYISDDDDSDDGDKTNTEGLHTQCDAYYDDDSTDNEEEDQDVQSRPETTVNQTVLKAMKHLGASFNQASRIIEETKAGMALSLVVEPDATALNAHSVKEEPSTFQEARNHPDPEQCRKWREAIRKQFSDMNKCHV